MQFDVLRMLRFEATNFSAANSGTRRPPPPFEIFFPDRNEKKMLCCLEKAAKSFFFGHNCRHPLIGFLDPPLIFAYASHGL